MPPAAEEVFESVAENFDLPEGARAFAKQLVCGVMRRRDELDALLADYARNWRVSRMAAVDRNVLRIAAYELLRTDTPTSVILDQAIELARRFGDEPSPAFVNGVLDAVAHAVERPATSAAGHAGVEEPE
jgi:N utilization substance protein B